MSTLTEGKEDRKPIREMVGYKKRKKRVLFVMT